jgi:hypothetical protein
VEQLALLTVKQEHLVRRITSYVASPKLGPAMALPRSFDSGSA